MHISFRRIWGMILRHLYNFRHSLDRLVDAFYWPALDIVVWGLTISAIERQGDVTPYYVAMIVNGIVLWYVLWRGQYEVTVNILEEFWNENLTNILSSPLTVPEWIISLFSLGFAKLFLTITFTALVGYFLYGVNILVIGVPLFFLISSLLIMGWAFGLLVGGLFLRHGTGIQTLAWAGGFVLMPFSATYYPLDTLPGWVQAVGHWLPSTYVFEGMRMVLQTGSMPAEMLIKSFALNAVYLVLTSIYFMASFRAAKARGLAHVK